VDGFKERKGVGAFYKTIVVLLSKMRMLEFWLCMERHLLKRW